MRVAVVGYGRMGRDVEAALQERGHETVVVKRGEECPAGCTVGIDFSVAAAVPGNLRAALAAGMRYVIGTTGWSEYEAEVRRLVSEAGQGLVYAANFSIGVNLFYRIAGEAAALLARFPEYDPYLVERHHRLKRDAPSGTAKVLAAIVEKRYGRAPGVASVRAGGIIGDHSVGFDSGQDEIVLEHRARNRKGFALGAVLAAEWIATRTGVYGFEDVLAERLT